MRKWLPYIRIHLASALKTFLILIVLYAIPFILGIFGLMPGEHEEGPLLYLYLMWTIFPVSLGMCIAAIPFVLVIKHVQKILPFSWQLVVVLAFPVTLALLLLALLWLPTVAVVPLVFVSLIMAPARLTTGTLSWVDLALCALTLSLPFMIYWILLHRNKKTSQPSPPCDVLKAAPQGHRLVKIDIKRIATRTRLIFLILCLSVLTLREIGWVDVFWWKTGHIARACGIIEAIVIWPLNFVRITPGSTLDGPQFWIPIILLLLLVWSLLLSVLIDKIKKR